MMLLFYLVIGGLIGLGLSWAVDTKADTPLAVIIAAVGGLVGGLVLQILLPWPPMLFGTLGAIIGALGLMWAMSGAARD